jgi:hypothetical protein
MARGSTLADHRPTAGETLYLLMRRTTMPDIGNSRCAPWLFGLTFSLVVFSVPAGAAAGPPKNIGAEVNGTPITRQRFQIDYRPAVNDHVRKGNPVNEA